MPDPGTPARMRERLAALAPVVLEIEDQSARHAGHAGAREGGHYFLVLQSPLFAGKTTMERHRMVYECLGDLRSMVLLGVWI
jgi:BolA protein